MRTKITDAVKAKSTKAFNSFDIVGDIAITKLPDKSLQTASAVAEAIMNSHKNVKSVLAQNSAVNGEFRVRKLTCIGGENRTRTLHRESGCVFEVDVGSCYFSPRLSGERLRIARLVQSNEVVVNMFAGVGCFSILIAKQVPSARVYSIDKNPDAFTFMKNNIRLNRVFGKVTPMLGDAKKIIQNSLQGCADRVLMPLPEKAYEYLPAAASTLKPSGGWVHVHAFEHAVKAEQPIEKVKQNIRDALGGIAKSFEISQVRVVRSTGPNWWQLVVDVHVGKF